MRFEVFGAEIIHIVAFCAITVCSLVGGGTYWLYVQCRICVVNILFIRTEGGERD
jgi:hypothetical protein